MKSDNNENKLFILSSSKKSGEEYTPIFGESSPVWVNKKTTIKNDDCSTIQVHKCPWIQKISQHQKRI
jgi:hypothetical protein